MIPLAAVPCLQGNCGGCGGGACPSECSACGECVLVTWPAFDYVHPFFGTTYHVTGGSALSRTVVGAPPCTWSGPSTGPLQNVVLSQGSVNIPASLSVYVFCYGSEPLNIPFRWQICFFLVDINGNNRFEFKTIGPTITPSTQCPFGSYAGTTTEGSACGFEQLLLGPPTATVAAASCDDPQLGACCEPSGECRFTTEGFCNSIYGNFRGVGTSCATADCEQPPPDAIGACCVQTLLPGCDEPPCCINTTKADCAIRHGAWLGPNNQCGPHTICPSQNYGACCFFINGQVHCQITDQLACDNLNGIFQGIGTVCGPNNQICALSFPQTKQDYDAIPTGTLYIAPDGTRRRKQ